MLSMIYAINYFLMLKQSRCK